MMCGILAILLQDEAAGSFLHEGLQLLQHRGQDACGIVTCGQKGRFYQAKANGMVRDVLDGGTVSSLLGTMGVGHGSSLSSCAAPAHTPACRLLRKI